MRKKLTKIVKKARECILPTVITIVVFYAVMEVVTRLKQRYREQPDARILRMEEFPQADQLLRNKTEGPGGVQYYDYYIFAGRPNETELYSFTDYYSARRVPDSAPIAQGDITVWLFGGSTMANAETTDQLSIANQVALHLKSQGHTPTVVNFGMGGFQSSLESIKFQDILRRVPQNEIPNVVVFYDGFNDAGIACKQPAGGMQQDISRKMEALVEGKHGKLLVYSLCNILGHYSSFWEHKVNREVSSQLFPEHEILYDPNNIRQAFQIYERNTRMLRGVCRAFDITPVFLLQPMIFTKTPLTPFEQEVRDRPGDQKNFDSMIRFYTMAREQMAPYEDFYDLSYILNGSTRNDFYDYGHTGPYTAQTTGHEIGKIITATLSSPSP